MAVKSVYKIELCVDEVILRALHQEIFPTDEWCGIKNTVAWVVWNGKEPIGFCMLEIHERNSEKFVDYTRAGILPMYEGHGLHVRMIRTRERWARKAGFKGAITYTTVDNYGSFLNLQKCGYKLYAPAKKYADTKRVKMLYWRKEL